MAFFQIYKVTTPLNELPIGVEPTQRVIEAESAEEACYNYDPAWARRGLIAAKEVPEKGKKNANQV